jgi:S-adenosylmethionine hydrolase
MSCITLLSDFGHSGASAAIAKGILMQYNPGIDILDISHEVIPFHTGEAAYLLASAANNFPAGTCHVALCDMFSEPTLKLLFCSYREQHFICADNGILPLALSDAHETWLIRTFTREEAFGDWLHEAGRTISLSSKGHLHEDLQPVAPKLPNRKYRPVITTDEIMCDAMHIDHHENVVLNITRQQFEEQRQGRQFSLQFIQVEEITELSISYNDVREGYKLCRFNSNDYLEISVNRGKAASLFGLRPGGKHNNIKITFE